MEILRRELVYIWYYVTVQLEQILGGGCLEVVGSAVSVFAKDSIHRAFRSLQRKQLGILGIAGSQRMGDCLPFMHVRHHTHRSLFFQERYAG